ncbi:hypothetical protein RS030_101607 [Cryptosporidium xiaoi]|uniref:CRAL-TRIO domain-containing protein n=1 Tax=Cryptosporidium xiaoi TaxID=659607 RepID=A0AAV9Y302_9CRYT
MSKANIEDIVVRCNLKDGFVRTISEASSKERLEISDIISGCELEGNGNFDLESFLGEESMSYSELFSSINNKPQNWDSIQYEKFKELCKNVISEIYEGNNVGVDNISSRATANKAVIDNCCKVMLTPLRLLRFLVGFNFNTENAFTAFSKHIKWRKEFNIDTVIRPFVITNMLPNNNIEMAPLHSTITRYYPCNLLLRESIGEKKPLRDKYGNIICIERFGLLDDTRLLGAVKVDELLLWYSYHMEYRSILLDKLSFESKCLIRATCIMDLYGLTVSQVHSSHIITILRRMIQLASDNYPEGMSYVIFVNAPKFFSIVWNSFKSLLAARTVEKILVLDEDYREKLLGIISLNNLPQFLGGLATEQYSTVPNTGTLLLDCFGLGDDRQTLHIKRMKKEKITISIIKPNTLVYWTWGVLEGEIGFGVKYLIDDIHYLNDSNESGVIYQNNNISHTNKSNQADNLNISNNVGLSSIQTKNQHEVTVVSSSKFDSTKAHGGSYYASVPGCLMLQWDNSWSLFSGKTIHFVIKTINSEKENSEKKQVTDCNNNNNIGNEDTNSNINVHNNKYNNNNNNIGNEDINSNVNVHNNKDNNIGIEDINSNVNVHNNNDNNNSDNNNDNNNSSSNRNSYASQVRCSNNYMSTMDNKLADIKLPNLDNIVSHNITLTTISRKKPSKNLKSTRIVNNGIVSNSFLEKQGQFNNIYYTIPIFNDNKATESQSLGKNLSKRDNKHKANRISVFNNNNNYIDDRVINKCNKSYNINVKHEKKIQTDNLNILKNVDINESNFNLNLNSNSESDFEEESNDSECKTNFSYVTAYSVIDDSVEQCELGNSIVINSSRGILIRKDVLNYDKKEFICPHSRKDSNVCNNNCCVKDNHFYISGKNSNIKTLENYGTYTSRSNSDLSLKNKYSSIFRKSIESRIDIYGCENFGVESYSSIFRQSYIENYLKLNDSFIEKRCFGSSFDNGGNYLGGNNHHNNHNNRRRLVKLLDGVKKIKKISESLLSKTCSEEKDKNFNKYNSGINKMKIRCKFFNKIKTKFRT